MLEEQRQEPEKRRKKGASRCLRAAVSARLHSKPRNEGQEYLELWSLKLNRARWAQAEKATAAAEERRPTGQSVPQCRAEQEA